MHQSTSPAGPPLWAVVLAGGIGSRFWPVSTPRRPKQLLPLATNSPLIVDTVTRIRPLIPKERLLILTGEELAAPILDALPDLSSDNLLVEPQAKGTAPVLAWAAHEIARRDPKAVMVSLHADHVIKPGDAFRDLLLDVARLASAHGHLFTLGIAPSRPETGYGYIRVGEPLSDKAAAYRVSEFVEKPDDATAARYVESGAYLWNSGIFIWTAAGLLEELHRHSPEIGPLLPLLGRGSVRDFFQRAPHISIDEGLLERSGNVAVARATFEWDDLGAWDALGRSRTRDEAGNVAMGEAHLVDSRNCVAWSEGNPVVVFGADDLVVVQAGGVTFVTPRQRSANLKDLLQQLPENLRLLDE